MKKLYQKRKSNTPPRAGRRRVLVTAGPTREFFDPVRFLSNPSSGKMGYALAEESASRGHEVVLVSGPVALPPPPKVRLVRVVSALEMYRAVLKEARRSDVIIMAAAVSDFRPAHYKSKKLKKTGRDLVVRFLPNPDILKTLGLKKKPGQVLVGFAAETNDLIKNAKLKIALKNLDAIIANRVGVDSGGFESDRNQAVVLKRDGTAVPLPSMTKKRLAARILGLLSL